METNVATPPGESVLKVDNLWVRKGGLKGFKWIVKGVSFVVNPGELVAVIGPNGAGKTKMFEAITGDRPYAGHVWMRGQDMYANPEYWLRRIGWVPSYNVLHDSLRVRQALMQIGRLRLPGRPEKVIQARIEALLDELEFPEDRRDALVRNLSSGQRKRLDLCAELLTNPPLLMLDEPTTNLDPDAERHLMELLSRRAREEGQAILIVTHTLQSLNFCQRIIYLANGRVRAVGDYEQVLDQLEDELGVEDLVIPAWEDSNQLVAGSASADDASRWAEIYRKSKVFDEEPLGETPEKTPPPRQARFSVSTRDWGHELRVLLKRNWLLFVNNPSALALYLLLGPFSGFLSRIVLRDNAFIQNEDAFAYSAVFDTSDARQAIFIIALVVTLLGLIGSFLDITRERPIYHYERGKGLSPWAYLLSKWIMLSVIVGLLAPTLMMFILTFQGQQMPAPYLVMVTLFLACIASVTLGLAISAASNSERTATGLLGIVVVFNLFFSGGVDFNERFQPFLERISVFAPSHWAAEGISVGIQIYCWASNPRFQDFFSLGHLASVWLYLVVFILVALGLAFVALRMQDIWFARRDRIFKALLNEHMLLLLPLIIIAWSWALFLNHRSQEYFHLRADADNVRIENALYRNLFQTVNGYVSQSQCPAPTPLPPMPTPMVAVVPTQPLSATETIPVEPALVGEPTQAPFGEVTETITTPAAPVASTVESDPGIAPLPVGAVVSTTPILFGPYQRDIPLEVLPPNAAFTLLGKDLEGNWFRIKEDHTGRRLVGWVPVRSTNLLPALTGEVGSPPACAAPRAFLESDGIMPVVSWKSDVDGYVVAVLDVFRNSPGVETVPSQLVMKVNGEVIDAYPIQPSRQAFLFRGLVIETRVNMDEILEFFIETPLSDETLYMRGSMFFVPVGCSF